MGVTRKPTTKGIFKALLSEGLGAFTFTFVTVCAYASSRLISSDGWLPARLLVDAVVHGLSYGFCIYLAIYQTWECHFFNPAIATAISLAESLSHGTRWPMKHRSVIVKTLSIIGVQLLGTLAGICVVFLVIPNAVGNKEVLGTPQLRFGSTFGSGFLLESLGSFFLTLIVLVAVSFHQPMTRSSSIAVAVGLASSALQLFLYPFTSASLNPTRAISLMLCSWSFSLETLLYLTAPFVGSLLATLYFIGSFTVTPLDLRMGESELSFQDHGRSGIEDPSVNFRPSDADGVAYVGGDDDLSKRQVYEPSKSVYS